VASDSTFDVVSKVDSQEVSNALNQAQKEIAQRYDFKGVGAEIDFSGEKILMKASSEERVKAVKDVFESKLVKRGISLKSLDAGAPFASGKEYRIEATMKEGIDHREEDHQADPRRGPQVRQGPDPGGRAARVLQVPRRPAVGHRDAQGLRGRGPAVRELPLIRTPPPLRSHQESPCCT